MRWLSSLSVVLLVIVISGYFSNGICQQNTTPTLAIDNKTTKTLTPKDDAEAQREAIKILRQLEEKYKKIETITGEFKQLKRSTVFLEEIKSQGVFYFKKPGKFRCDYLPPNESINWIIDDTAWLYVPEIKQAEKYYFGKSGSKVQRLNQMLLGFGISVNDLLEVYEVKTVEKDPEKHTIAILFRLRKPSPDVNFESITIWFDTETLFVKKIYIDEVGDDETIIDIKEIKLNKRISDTLFRPFFPKDVEIIEHY
ncbi:outer membrane lipoprotein carrier protein LolA [Candidatus Sumerlaeota bacterium]|nr:outer membrane lipoprotein carrier protein LolA [Candidatus Sumerlaeota bacterium]